MFELLKKELRGEKNWILGLCGFAVGINLLLLPFAEQSKGAISGPILFLTVSAFPLLAFIRAILIWKNEWDHNNALLLFSIPGRGYQFVLSKLGAIAVEIFLYLFIAFLLPYFIVNTYSTEYFQMGFNEFLKVWFTYSFTVFLAVPFAFFSYLAGRFFTTNKIWVSLGALVIAIILFRWYHHFGRQWFSFLPAISFSVNITKEYFSNTYQLASHAAAFLFDCLLLWASSFLLEKAEV